MNRSLYKRLKGFTLVELIVVITILAVLGTIAFLSIQGYSASARDSDRIENLANLNKGLSVFQTKTGYYPQPEGPLTIMASGNIIGNQGFARDQVTMLAGLSPGGSQDPSDSSMYDTYLVNTAGTKMQLMSFLENGNSITSAGLPIGISEAYASATNAYSTRTPFTRGDPIGILLSTAPVNLNQPLQENVSATFTGIDFNVFTGVLSDGTPVSLTALLSKSESIVGTGILMAIESNLRGKMRLIMPVCPTVAGWTDIGTTSTSGGAQIQCTNNGGTTYPNCRICETNNNGIIPAGSVIVTQSGACNSTNFNDTGWTTPSGGLGASCSLTDSLSLCHMCISTADSPIPTGTIVLMQSCPTSWNDLGGTLGGGASAGCFSGKNCRICQKQ